MIEFKLANYLKSRPAVSSLVGDRVHAEKTPQGVSGARIVYRRAAGDRTYTSEGSSGLVTASIVTTCHANEGGVIDTAVAVYEAVRNQIDGFSGSMDGVEVDRCVIGPYAYGSALPGGGDEVGCPAVNATVSITYREALPTGVTP